MCYALVTIHVRSFMLMAPGHVFPILHIWILAGTIFYYNIGRGGMLGLYFAFMYSLL